MAPQDLLSPKQVARALGVSESSLKRWCDQGLIATVRTAGGHRKMACAEVLRYIREHNFPLVSPELLGLPPVAQFAEAGLERGQTLLAEALLAGDETVARQILFELYLAKQPLHTICDRVIAPAFREIGERWCSQRAEIYQERRACEITLRAIYELRRLLPEPQTTLLAYGGTPTADSYELPNAMVEIVLRELGYRTVQLGCSIPFDSLAKAVLASQPQLFWLSTSHIHDDESFVREFAVLSTACEQTKTALVVGGRAFTETIRHQLVYGAFCDNMQHLAAFARTLFHTLNKPHTASAPDV
jgi:excisionase family DNA binding protein